MKPLNQAAASRLICRCTRIKVASGVACLSSLKEKNVLAPATLQGEAEMFEQTKWLSVEQTKVVNTWHCEREIREGGLRRGKEGKMRPSQRPLGETGLSRVISTSVACQSHHGWPCPGLFYKRDPLSRLGWADPSHSVCLRASRPHTASVCASLTPQRNAVKCSCREIGWNKKNKVFPGKQDHMYMGPFIVLLYCVT